MIMLTVVKAQFHTAQLVFACSLLIGTICVDLNNYNQLLNVVKFVLYFLTVIGVREAFGIVHRYNSTKSLCLSDVVTDSSYFIIFSISAALVYNYKQPLFVSEFLYVGCAYLIVWYPRMEGAAGTPEGAADGQISYGVGMACSFFEGYLRHVLPSDGSSFVGFEENINALEDSQGIVFPVKKLFIVITKSLYCPPDLKEFNKGNKKTRPYLEAIQSLEDVVKNVAGVQNRVYRNSAYKVYRPGRAPVHLAVECATPLHTLHKVLRDRELYQELPGVDRARVVAEFCGTLAGVLRKSDDCRGKCDLVYFDDTDESLNLAEVLLERIAQLEPDFEEMLQRNN